MEAARIVQNTLVALFGDAYGATMGVRLWNGTRVQGTRERFTLVVSHPGALRTALRAPFDLSAGRAFAAGLRLAPDERLLDIGCGWGALVIRAAQTFGARALGIALSRSQLLARPRADGSVDIPPTRRDLYA